MLDVGDLSVGQVFGGRYRIERLLKAGGMGAVYRATHTETSRTVALKLMRPEIVVDAQARERFAQEARVSSMIESSHVVDVLDAGIDAASGNPFIAMEFLQGQ